MNMVGHRRLRGEGAARPHGNTGGADLHVRERHHRQAMAWEHTEKEQELLAATYERNALRLDASSTAPDAAWRASAAPVPRADIVKAAVTVRLDLATDHRIPACREKIGQQRPAVMTGHEVSASSPGDACSGRPGSRPAPAVMGKVAGHSVQSLARLGSPTWLHKNGDGTSVDSGLEIAHGLRRRPRRNSTVPRRPRSAIPARRRPVGPGGADWEVSPTTPRPAKVGSGGLAARDKAYRHRNSADQRLDPPTCSACTASTLSRPRGHRDPTLARWTRSAFTAL